MDKSIDALFGAIQRLTAILGDHGEIKQAKSIPDNLVSDVSRVKLLCRDGYDSCHASEDAIRVVQASIAEALKTERRRGEMLRDEKLAKLSAEIGSLRAVLPSLAAQAAIALGAVERSLVGKTDD